MVRIIDDLKSAPVLFPLVAIVLLGRPALIAFTAGLARAGLLGWWLPAVATAGVVAYLVTDNVSDHLVVLAGFLPLAAVWVAQARLLVGRPSVEQIELTGSRQPRPTGSAVDA